MKHWLDLSDAEIDAMTEEQRQEHVRLSIENDIELLELVKAGLWVRTPYQTIYRLPLCHDFGAEQ